MNTSSCLGLFKEIIVDRTFDGSVSNPACPYIVLYMLSIHMRSFLLSLQPIPKNVFIVAACNPHRGNSLASHRQKKKVGGAYYVRQLHPTLHFLMWDYGSLDKHQEREYINVKMKMHNRKMAKADVRECELWCVTCGHLLCMLYYLPLYAGGKPDRPDYGQPETDARLCLLPALLRWNG